MRLRVPLNSIQPARDGGNPAGHAMALLSIYGGSSPNPHTLGGDHSALETGVSTKVIMEGRSLLVESFADYHRI
jgi:hypothetical protein